MKNSTLTLLFIFLISFAGFGQSKKAVELKWKINAGDTLKYITTMKPVEMKEETEAVTEDTSDSLGDVMASLRKQMMKMAAENEYAFVLYQNPKNNNHIDINMLRTKGSDFLSATANNLKTNSPADSVINVFKDYVNMNIVLRGRIDTNGKLISNYYKNGQRNLIALLFCLPQHSVKKGDSWEIQNVNLIEMDQSFYCDSVSSYNKATLKDIKTENGKTLAVIEYDISQYISGKMSISLSEFTKELKDTDKHYMAMNHKAIGIFSITDGKWLSYEGIMTSDSNIFFASGKSTTLLKLKL